MSKVVASAILVLLLVGSSYAEMIGVPAKLFLPDPGNDN